MTRNEALEIAKAQYAKYQKHSIDEMFGRAATFDAFALYGYKHGWIIVGEHSFNNEDLTGRPYHCEVQKAFAYL